VVSTGLGYAASRGVALLHPALLQHGAADPGGGTAGLSLTTATPVGAGGYGTIVLTTLAEEMLFRGFLAGLLIRRLGFAGGNAVQAILFLAPHALLLVVSVAFWPLLPAQLIAGWLLGWLRHRSGSIAPGWIAHAAANILAPTLLSTCRESDHVQEIRPGVGASRRTMTPIMDHLTQASACSGSRS